MPTFRAFEVFHFGAAMSAMSTWQQALALLDRAKECDAANIVSEHQQTWITATRGKAVFTIQCCLLNVWNVSHEHSRATLALMDAVHVTVSSHVRLSKVVVNSAINRCAKGGAWLVAIKLLHGTDCTPDVISDLANFWAPHPIFLWYELWYMYYMSCTNVYIYIHVGAYQYFYGTVSLDVYSKNHDFFLDCANAISSRLQWCN